MNEVHYICSFEDSIDFNDRKQMITTTCRLQ